MKKALILPILVGLVWVCNASPKATVFTIAETQYLVSIENSLLDEVFGIAAPLFASEHGIEISPNALMDYYENGTVSVVDLGDNSYEVNLGGHWVISDLGDQF
jgi:hypothetical protein